MPEGFVRRPAEPVTTVSLHVVRRRGGGPAAVRRRAEVALEVAAGGRLAPAAAGFPDRTAG